MSTQTKSVAQAKSSSGASLYEPDQMVQLAAHLQTFFAENNLLSEIQGKPYVKVAGWQYAGTKLGIIPMVESVDDVSSEKHTQYQTRVALLNIKTDTYVGCGVGLCSSAEPGKKNKPAYAIQSLSQTRAIGKAYRNLLGWVIDLAGFESTPVEEMSTSSNLSTSNGQNNLGIHHDGENKIVSTATNAQRTDLLIALNHECISQDERDQMFSCIYSMSSERCEKALAKVQQKINQYDLDNH
ncbi:MAG: hypothetical protein AAF944_04605 [Bacteroidota bacterium]